MCYYNGQKVTRAEYIRLKHLEKLVADYDFLSIPVLDGFDYGPGAVLKATGEGTDFDLVKMEWGFVPPYLKSREEIASFRNMFTTLNAKAENLFLNEKGKPSMFRHAALERRCLVLSSGFFESRHVFHKNKRTGELRKTAERYPYHIHLPGSEYFFMAGIWNPWKAQDGTGEYAETFAIVTTVANELMSVVHNTKKRMPVILDEELAFEWLFGDLDEKRISEIAMAQYPASKMAAYSIQRNYKNALDPVDPFEYPDLPSLSGDGPQEPVQRTLF